MSQTPTLPGAEIGQRMKEAFGTIDIRSALRLSFGKCPHCGDRLTRGSWLQFCTTAGCHKHIGPLNKALQQTIEYVKPKTAIEQTYLQAHAARMGVTLA